MFIVGNYLKKAIEIANYYSYKNQNFHVNRNRIDGLYMYQA